MKAWRLLKLAVPFLAGIAVAFLSRNALAVPITLMWDHPLQPAGVTFELVGNGQSTTGITGLQLEIDLPLGDDLDAAVRAWPPPGWQCGDPLVDCPDPSDWATLAITAPQTPENLTIEFLSRTPEEPEIVSQWYYADGWTGDGDGDNNLTSGWEPDNYAYGSDITIGASGNITKLAVKARTNGGSVTPKIAIYDSSDDLVASGTGAAFNTPGSGLGDWKEIDIAAVAVSSGDYKILASGSTWQFGMAYVNGTNGYGRSVTYANFPESTLGTTVTETVSFGLKVFVETSTATTETETLSIDAMLAQEDITGTTTLDSLLQQQALLQSAVIDAAVQGTPAPISADLDALAQSTFANTVSLSSLLQQVKSGDLSADALLQVLRTAGVGLDSVLITQGVNSVITLLDAALQIQDEESEVSLDGLIQQESLIASVVVDAMIQAGFLETVSVDAALRAVKTGSISLDSVLIQQGVNLETILLDALLRQSGLAATTEIDGVLAVEDQTATLSLDSVLSPGAITETVVLDGLIQGTQQTNVDMDSLIQVADQIAGPISLDSMIAVAKTGAVSIEAIVAAVRTSTVAVAALLQASVSSALSLDAFIGDLAFIAISGGRTVLVEASDNAVAVRPSDWDILLK